MNEACLLIPGIRHDPDDMFTWTDRAQRIISLDHKIPCEKLEYKVGALRTKNILKKLARDLADVILLYNSKGYCPNVLTHSNGAVVFCLAYWLEPSMKVNQWHAIAPACYASCNDNGLNEAINNGVIKKAFNYFSQEDRVAERIGMFTFLNYGKAGYSGFEDIANPAKVKNVNMFPWGHSTFAGVRRLPSFLNSRIIPSFEK